MLTHRGVGLLAGAVSCLVAGRLVGIPALDVVGIAALGLLAVALLAVFRRPPLVVARPEHLPVVDHGDPIDVRITLRNSGRLAMGSLLLTDTTPGDLHTGATATLRGLDAGRQVPLSYRAIGRRRGRHEFGPLTATLTDPMTLARRPVALPGASRVLVLPRRVALPRGPRPVAGRVPGDQGAGTPRPFGDDVGMIREYVIGDDLRRIHWPATAHRGGLMVRQPESRQRQRGVVLLDRRPSTGFELVVEAAASIGAAWDGLGASVQVVDDPRDMEVSRLPWEVQLERLATVEPEEGWDLQSLTALLAGGAAGSGTLVVVSGDPVGLPDTLQRLGRHFDTRIVVMVESGSTAVTRNTAAATAAALRWRVVRIERLEDLPAAWEDAGRPHRLATTAGA
ncbi:DUF58 domain-containing protein [Salsipaludibacter albus]|uniref:DUF58 domain-containing protein n=1 Tax=Salsipaludibacter albus TaxID=2849650 RepID=UPI001EE4BB99|nr:DUF58 domain-containing protein [Salsipaludibacter albus]MBY5163227.1 DUF58 domain-containing protein [Salsipaludibacter albus]